MNQELNEKLTYIILKSINEARIQRTIPPKIWATVSSVISKKYRQDKGATAKAVGTPDVILQKYVTGLIIFKAQCPRTDDELLNSEVFPLWAKAVLANGYSINDVIKLYNENAGTQIPYSIDSAEPQTGMTGPAIEPVEEPVVEPEPEPVYQKPEREWKPAPEPKPVIKEDGYEFTSELRIDDPGKGYRGYRTQPMESYIIPYTEGDLDTVWEQVVNKYNSMKYKTKCRSGLINIKLCINLYDPEEQRGYQGIIQREGAFKSYEL